MKYLWLLVLLLTLSGCPKKKISRPPKNVLTDATGYQVDLKPVQRIISLSPETTELVRILGAENRLVGKTMFCSKKIQADVVGTLLQPNLEKIVSLKPDLILATLEGNSSKGVLPLRKMGYRVFVVGTKRNFTDIRLGFFLVARLLQNEKKAQKLMAGWESRLDRIGRLVARESKPTVFWEIWPKPLRTAGSSTYHQAMITLARGRNTADHLSRYPLYSLEEVMVQNPQIILILQSSPRERGRVAFWKKFSQLRAVKKGRIHLIDPSFSLPTPPIFVRGVEKLAHLFHPRVFAHEK